jgi:N-acetyl-anhydromuramyl-L-alanine amidase AmpD
VARITEMEKPTITKPGIANMRGVTVNYSERNDAPSAIILHAIGEYIDLEEDMFCMYYLDSIGLSCHYYVTPSGVILQTAPDNFVTYHAKGHNQYSIGIEIIVSGLHTYETFLDAIAEPYVTDAQEGALVDLSRYLSKQHNIKPSNIFRHSDISPGRKKDPGAGFDMEAFIHHVKTDSEKTPV